MNLREAWRALKVLHRMTRIARADLKPDDVIVMEYDGSLSAIDADRIKMIAKGVFPNHKVLVMSDGITMKAVSDVP